MSRPSLGEVMLPGPRSLDDTAKSNHSGGASIASAPKDSVTIAHRMDALEQQMLTTHVRAAGAAAAAELVAESALAPLRAEMAALKGRVDTAELQLQSQMPTSRVDELAFRLASTEEQLNARIAVAEEQLLGRSPARGSGGETAEKVAEASPGSRQLQWRQQQQELEERVGRAEERLLTCVSTAALEELRLCVTAAELRLAALSERPAANMAGKLGGLEASVLVLTQRLSANEERLQDLQRECFTQTGTLEEQLGHIAQRLDTNAANAAAAVAAASHNEEAARGSSSAAIAAASAVAELETRVAAVEVNYQEMAGAVVRHQEVVRPLIEGEVASLSTRVEKAEEAAQEASSLVGEKLDKLVARLEAAESSCWDAVKTAQHSATTSRAAGSGPLDSSSGEAIAAPESQQDLLMGMLRRDLEGLRKELAEVVQAADRERKERASLCVDVTQPKEEAAVKGGLPQLPLQQPPEEERHNGSSLDAGPGQQEPQQDPTAGQQQAEGATAETRAKLLKLSSASSAEAPRSSAGSEMLAGCLHTIFRELDAIRAGAAARLTSIEVRVRALEATLDDDRKRRREPQRFLLVDMAKGSTGSGEAQPTQPDEEVAASPVDCGPPQEEADSAASMEHTTGRPRGPPDVLTGAGAAAAKTHTITEMFKQAMKGLGAAALTPSPTPTPQQRAPRQVQRALSTPAPPQAAPPQAAPIPDELKAHLKSLVSAVHQTLGDDSELAELLEHAAARSRGSPLERGGRNPPTGSSGPPLSASQRIWPNSVGAPSTSQRRGFRHLSPSPPRGGGSPLHSAVPAPLPTASTGGVIVETTASERPSLGLPSSPLQRPRQASPDESHRSLVNNSVASSSQPMQEEPPVAAVAAGAAVAWGTATRPSTGGGAVLLPTGGVAPFGSLPHPAGYQMPFVAAGGATSPRSPGMPGSASGSSAGKPLTIGPMSRPRPSEGNAAGPPLRLSAVPALQQPPPPNARSSARRGQ